MVATSQPFASTAQDTIAIAAAHPQFKIEIFVTANGKLSGELTDKISKELNILKYV